MNAPSPADVLPVVLPDGWAAEAAEPYGILIQAAGNGFVTVNEKKRNFELGICVVRMHGPYRGRGWRERLYADAVSALQQAIRR